MYRNNHKNYVTWSYLLTFNMLSSSGPPGITAKSTKYMTPQTKVIRNNIVFLQLCVVCLFIGAVLLQEQY